MNTQNKGNLKSIKMWNPDKKDIENLCDAILSHYVKEDRNSCDYCIYCFKKYGNIDYKYHSKGKQEPHEPDCPVLIARDVMTGIDL